MAAHKEQGPAKKFMFDLRRFDEPEEIAPEDLVPTFSEEELAAAREAGREEGKVEGHRLAVASREQLTANALRGIAESFTMLFAAEMDREKRYEEEAVALTLAALEKLFPVMNERFGQDEVRAVIMKVLQSRGRHSMITIEVNTDDAPGVEEMLAAHWTDPETAPRYRIIANPSLKPGQCQMSWEDGGAVRNAAELAGNIRQSLSQLLGLEQPFSAENVQDAQNNAIKEGDSGESSAPASESLDTQPGEPS